MWELDCAESWAPKNWCFWTVVLEKTLESRLDCKEIQPLNPKGNQFLIFIERTDVEAETPIFWPPDVKRWFIWKDPDAGKDWRQEEKGTTGDEASATRLIYFIVLSRVQLCNHMDYSLPGSSLHGLFQARVLDWDAIAFSEFSQ